MSEPSPSPHMSPEQFRELGRTFVDFIADYMEQVERYPVLSRSRPGEVYEALPEHPPRSPGSAEEWAEVFKDLTRVVLPGLTHWQSPNFFGFFPANTSGPAILGELLSAGLGVQGMLWLTSPACTELEMKVLDWLAEMLELPAGFRSTGAGGGVIHGTASEATLTAMVAARRRALDGGAPSGGRLAAYASTEAHSSVVKAAMISGVAAGSEDGEGVRLIEVDSEGRMRIDRLREALGVDVAAGRRPFFVCATVGTTGTTALDPVAEIAGALDTAPRRPWLHVDAAHAGAACICPEFRPWLAGVERADSFCFNPHKWLLTNFDCDCFYIADRRALIESLSISPEYLRNRASQSGAVIDYRDWQIPLGRRFRALKLWFVIRHYGVEGLRAHVREGVRLAALFEGLVRADDRFEVSAPRRMNLVCFRLRAPAGAGRDEADALNRGLLERINATGRAFLTHGALPQAMGGGVVLRLAIGGTATREEHVRGAWALIAECAAELTG